MRDLHELPKLRDSLSYLYVERVRIQQKHKAVELLDEDGRTMVPAAALSVLMAGPGTTITHAAVKALADNGCLLVWCGEDGMRCYAQGGGETRKAYHLLTQAELVSDPECYRLVAASARFIEAEGFAIEEDGRVVTLDLPDDEELEARAGELALSLSWVEDAP